MCHSKMIKIDRFFFVIAIVCFFVAAIMVLYQYSAPYIRCLWSPSLACDNAVADFGKIDSFANLSHTFTLRNRGKRNLVIEKVSPGCGACIEVISYTKTPISPGHSGVVSLAFLSEHLNGSVSKDALVKTNDPKNPNLILTLKAEVIHPDSNENSEVSAKP